MKPVDETIRSLQAAMAFSQQAPVFDERYEGDAMIRYKRTRVREHMLPQLRQGARLLELNCGTGNDAVFFAQKGFPVHATDLSSGMLEQLREKLEAHPELPVTVESCSFLRLDELADRGPFDHIYSNFGGLNCTGDLRSVLHSFSSLLRPGGRVTLVVISRFCFWETMLLFRGRFRTAFRRFFSSKGRAARVEGKPFTCWYYSPAYIRKALEQEYDVLSVEGLNTILPPSYIEGFADRYPKLFARLRRWEDRCKSRWPFRAMGDYFIISLQKKA